MLQTGVIVIANSLMIIIFSSLKKSSLGLLPFDISIWGSPWSLISLRVSHRAILGRPERSSSTSRAGASASTSWAARTAREYSLASSSLGLQRTRAKGKLGSWETYLPVSPSGETLARRINGPSKVFSLQETELCNSSWKFKLLIFHLSSSWRSAMAKTLI